MGCDIHIVLERKMVGRSQWIGVYSTDEAYSIVRRNMVAARRDYSFFAEVAGVRGESKGPKLYPRNLPEDMSDLTREQFWRAPTDYHSASHATPKEFADRWLAANTSIPEQFRQKDVRTDNAVYDLLGIDGDERFEYRVVFWFDN
jgi:hypothetical protein